MIYYTSGISWMSPQLCLRIFEMKWADFPHLYVWTTRSFRNMNKHNGDITYSIESGWTVSTHFFSGCICNWISGPRSPLTDESFLGVTMSVIPKSCIKVKYRSYLVHRGWLHNRHWLFQSHASDFIIYDYWVDWFEGVLDLKTGCKTLSRQHRNTSTAKFMRSWKGTDVDLSHRLVGSLRSRSPTATRTEPRGGC